ncbi:MAG TPA: LLM class F420-dependent oxidoreductase [Dehalococcoidia bacterium]|nr:LLM class F420-dependent oxidoreductase [Dehalococcoidia bacterium]
MKVAIGVGRDAIMDWDAVSTYAIEAEGMGVDCVWAAEAWSHDVVVPLAFLAAKTDTIHLGTSIMQIGTRTPAMIAMTAMALDSLTDGRFRLGLGTSGPQVIEGWHGVPFTKPVTRTREVIEIVQRIFNGETLSYDGEFHTLPLLKGATGEGKALRPGAPPPKNVPIYVASLGPKNLEMTGALADGWLGNYFIPEQVDVFLDPMRRGAEAAGRSLDDIDLQVGGTVWFTDDVDESLETEKRRLAFQIGAMGSRRQNFYTDVYARQGFADEAREVQRLWLAGERDEARARVPDELALSSNLIGDEQMIRERLRVYRDAGINTFRAGPRGSDVGERLETIGRLMDLVAEVTNEVA